MPRSVFPHQFSRISDCWSALLLEELVRLGVRHCCIAPGSRSTPLTLAALATPNLECHHHFDERGLAFFALGIARQRSEPVVLITTSGSAVANLYPAVVEAAQSGVPLIVLAADRPPELIGCGANQAIDQESIFARYPVWQRHLPVPSTDFCASALLCLVDEALLHVQAGPVFLNCPFREPFYPNEVLADFTDWLEPLGAWTTGCDPWVQFCVAPKVLPLPDEHFFNRPGVIVVGALKDEAQAQAVYALSARCGWPILADPQSGLVAEGVLTGLDLLLQHDAFYQAVSRAEHLLQVGARLVSKRLQQWIAGHCWREYWLLSPEHQRLDPQHLQQRRLLADIAPTLASWQPATSIPGPDLRHWPDWLAGQLAGVEEEFNELGVVRCVSQMATPMFLANSLTIRLYEQLGRGPCVDKSGWRAIYSNRGASGIDGLLATAAGVALGHTAGLTLVVGDLAFLHDLNSLALCARSETPLVIVLLNNDGGAIFDLLPVPDAPNVKTYYRGEHGITAEGAAKMFKLAYFAPSDIEGFCADYRQALNQNGASLIEVCSPPEEAIARLNALAARIVAMPCIDG